MSTSADLNVSRETFERLSRLVALLEKWNPRINLVSKSTLADVWVRHVQDSLQLFRLAPPSWRTWVDLGSGGGFPGLVIAILAKDKNSNAHVTLVESDQRKCAFLRTVIRELDLPASVLAQRIEDLDPLGADVISARALADLSTLLGFVVRHGGNETVSLFPKGASWEKEVRDAQAQWDFSYAHCKSETESKAVVLRIQGVARV
jgi:16S rRNA (guanine527-N7)-methyltransferase